MKNTYCKPQSNHRKSKQRVRASKTIKEINGILKLYSFNYKKAGNRKEQRTDGTHRKQIGRWT